MYRKNILSLEPYRCARDDYSEGILLDANENAIGPALVAPKEHEKQMDLHRYPDPLHLEAKQKVNWLNIPVIHPLKSFLFNSFCKH